MEYVGMFIGMLGMMLVILMIYHKINARNRSMEKIKRFTDRVHGELEQYVNDKFSEIKDFSIELDVRQETGKEIIKRVTAVEEELGNRASYFDTIKERLDSYDDNLSQLASMSEAVDANLVRLKNEAGFVNDLGKKIGSAEKQLKGLEKQLGTIHDDFDSVNHESLNAATGGLLTEVRGLVGAFNDDLEEKKEQVEALEKTVEEASSRAEKVLEYSGRDMEEERERVLSALTAEAERNHESYKNVLSDDLAEFEQKRDIIHSDIFDNIEQAENRTSSLIDKLDKDLDGFQDRLNALEDEYEGKIRQASERGQALEEEILRNLVNKINENAEKVEFNLSTEIEKIQEDLSKKQKELYDLFGKTSSDYNVWKATLDKEIREHEKAMEDRLSSLQKHFESAKQDSEKNIKEGFDGVQKTVNSFTVSVNDWQTSMTHKMHDTTESLDEHVSSVSDRINELMPQVETKFSSFKEWMKETLGELQKDGQGMQKESRREYERMLQNNNNEITAQIRRHIDSFNERFAEMENHVNEMYNESNAKIDTARQKIENTYSSLLNELVSKKELLQNELSEFEVTATESISSASERQLEASSKAAERFEAKLNDYEDDMLYRLESMQSYKKDIKLFEKNMAGTFETLKAGINQDFERFDDAMEEKRSSEQQRINTAFGDISKSIDDIEGRINELKRKSYENVSEKLKVFEDEFFDDLAQRDKNIKAELSGWKSTVQNDIQTAYDDFRKAQQETEENFLDLYNTDLGRIKDDASASCNEFTRDFEEKYTQTVQRLEDLANDAASNISNLGKSWENRFRELDELREVSEHKEQELLQKLEMIKNNAQQEMTERISEYKDIVSGSMNEHNEDIESRLKDLIVRLDDEKKQREKQLTGIEQEITASITTIRDSYTRSEKQIEEDMQAMQQKFDEKKQGLFTEMDDRYNTIAGQLREIEKRQADFVNQTKIFERTDKLKVELQQKTIELKEELGDIKEEKKGLTDINKNIQQLKKLHEDVNGKLTKFLSQKRKIDSMESDFEKIVNISSNVDLKMDKVTANNDMLQEILFKANSIIEAEDELEEKYTRLEKKKKLIESTISHVDNNFQNLQEIDERIKDITVSVEGIPPKIAEIENSIKYLNGKKPNADEVYTRISELDSIIDDIDRKMDKLESSREWLARTETRLNQLDSESREQLKLLHALVKQSPSSKVKRGKGAPTSESRKTVLQLAEKDWSVEEIAKMTELSMSEVELILEFALKK